MDLSESQRDELKRQAAIAAVDIVQSGMVVGLGSGSTAVFAIREIGRRLQVGELRNIQGLPTSDVVAREAQLAQIPLIALEKSTRVDVTIDGADEVDPQLNLIKGGGGALLREKIVAQSSHREIIVVDEMKLSPVLGTRHPLPVEVVPFAWQLQCDFLERLGSKVTLRQKADGTVYCTDQGNYILDCQFGPIHELDELAEQLAQRAGIVEHGLFLGIAHDLIVAGQGGIEHRSRPISA